MGESFSTDFFVQELPVLFVVFVGLIEGVVGVHQDHVDELLEEGRFEVMFEVLSKHFVRPESCEYFVGVHSVLELLVKLVRPTRVRNPAVKPNQPVGEVSTHHCAASQLLMHYSCLGVHQEVKDQFHEPCRDVRVGNNILLTEKQTSQLQDLSDVLLSHSGQVGLFDAEHSLMVLAHESEK